MDILRVSNLRTTYHTRKGPVDAIRGVTFSVAKGEIFGLLGESGSGKSSVGLSILKLLPDGARIHPGSSVRFEDAELLDLDEKRMRALRGSKIAMIFQDPKAALDPVMTVGRQIEEALHAHGNGSRSQARKKAQELLRMVQMPDPMRRVDSYPHQLSGGMRQRVMIAIALACSPSLVIADEPTTALDVTIEAQVLRLLVTLQVEHGLSMLLITHDFKVIEEVAGRVGVMQAGHLMEVAPTRELFGSPVHPYTQSLLKGSLDLRSESVSGQGPAKRAVREDALAGKTFFTPGEPQAFDGEQPVAAPMPEMMQVREGHFVALRREAG